MEMLNISILRCGNIIVRHQKLEGGEDVYFARPPAPMPMIRWHEYAGSEVTETLAPRPGSGDGEESVHGCLLQLAWPSCKIWLLCTIRCPRTRSPKNSKTESGYVPPIPSCRGLMAVKCLFTGYTAKFCRCTSNGMRVCIRQPKNWAALRLFERLHVLPCRIWSRYR